MPESFLKGILPFVSNMKKGEGSEPSTKKITTNGRYNVMNNSYVEVNVKGGKEEEDKPTPTPTPADNAYRMTANDFKLDVTKWLFEGGG